MQVHLQYSPPAGAVGAPWPLFGREPSQTIREDLRRFKQMLEPARSTAASDEGRRPPMKAVCWYGKEDVRVETVPDPHPQSARRHRQGHPTAICGSDLHIYDGYIPTMQQGDILGHEFMGEVVEVGRDKVELKVGDRVVVPFTIACGRCFFCKEQLWSLCDNSNPNAWMAEKLYGYSGSGLFGYSHMCGGYAGGQAEYARVPFADVGPDQGARRAVRRAGAVPLRHLPDRLHGGRELQHPAGRHGRGLGLRPGRPVRDQERVPARRRAR